MKFKAATYLVMTIVSLLTGNALQAQISKWMPMSMWVFKATDLTIIEKKR